MSGWLALVMFIAVCLVLMAGFPVAFSLAGTAIAFALIGAAVGIFQIGDFGLLPYRLFGIMTNETLVAVPLFVFMGVMLERSKVAENLLDTMALSFGSLRGGMGVAVMVVGMLLAASTGIVGATVVTMGLLSLPAMLKRGYDPSIAAGTICASGTLGQIIPPSIILVLLGDVLSSAYQQAQLSVGNHSPDTLSVGDLFAGALLPGLLLVGAYIIWLGLIAWLKPGAMPPIPASERRMDSKSLAKKIVFVLLPPLLLIVVVLGSILGGLATPTEAASLGAIGSMLLALSQHQLNMKQLKSVMHRTTQICSMVFVIFIGASIFSLVFRLLGGDDSIHHLLNSLPGGVIGAMFAVMLLMFLLGFILDFIEITFVIVPIVGPVLLAMGLDPVWLGVMIALNLQTSFLTPPFGFALFYFRGVASAGVTTGQIYRGVIPFIVIQLLMLLALSLWPALATWLPDVIYD